MPKPLDYSSPTIFVDRNIDGHDICEILRKSGIHIERHNEHFDPEEDDSWILSVSNNSWAILTADQNIENHHLEAVIKAKLIILIGKRSGAIQWAASVIVSQEQIFRLLQNTSGPLVIKVNKSGQITRLYRQLSH